MSVFFLNNKKNLYKECVLVHFFIILINVKLFRRSNNSNFLAVQNFSATLMIYLSNN